MVVDVYVLSVNTAQYFEHDFYVVEGVYSSYEEAKQHGINHFKSDYWVHEAYERFCVENRVLSFEEYITYDDVFMMIDHFTMNIDIGCGD